MNRSSKIITAVTALLLTCMLGAPLSTAGDDGHKVNSSPLDHLVLFQDSIDRKSPIRMQPFSADKADVGKSGRHKYVDAARRMKETAPMALANALVDKLSSSDFPNVADWDENEKLPDNAIIIAGQFTVLIPGSQATRYWVGLGAGRSKVCGTGEFRTAGGETLARFDHCRVGFTGLTGGESSKQMTNDAYETGAHLAAFVAHWADGDYAD